MSTSNVESFYDDYVIRRFSVMAVVWGVVGMLVGVIVASQLAFPELNLGLPWTSFGRLRPLHTNLVIFAFGKSNSWNVFIKGIKFVQRYINFLE